ncbi:MAG: hypothetical protein ACR2PR_00590 [Pseudohongiellaceae bacterium]
MPEQNTTDELLAQMDEKLRSADLLLAEMQARQGTAHDVLIAGQESINKKKKKMEDLLRKIKSLLPDESSQARDN